MIREALIFVLLASLLWTIHGMDMQYYNMAAPAMFEVQIYTSVVLVFGLIVINAFDLKRRPSRGVA